MIIIVIGISLPTRSRTVGLLVLMANIVKGELTAKELPDTKAPTTRNG